MEKLDTYLERALAKVVIDVWSGAIELWPTCPVAFIFNVR